MHWKRNLLFLSLAQLIAMMAMSFFLPFIPLYLSELGVSDPAHTARWSGVIYGSGFLVLGLVLPFWGALADRLGRKLMVVRSMATGSLILFLSSFVHTPFQLLALRLLHGCFSGFASSCIALIAAESPAGSMGLGMGIFQGALTAGFIIGPFLGGILQDIFGIRNTILIGGLFLLLGTILVLIYVKEENKPAKHEETGNPFSNVAFVWRNPTLAPAARIQFISYFSMMMIQPFLALFVEVLAIRTHHELVGTFSGLVISASAFTMMIGAPLWGQVADKIGQKKVLTSCLFISGLLFIPQGFSQDVPQLFISRLLFGFFASGIAPSLQAMIAHHSPPERRGGVLGVSFSITLFANALGPFVGGMMASSLGLRGPFFLVAVILLGTSFLSRLLTVTFEHVKYPTLEEFD